MERKRYENRQRNNIRYRKYYRKTNSTICSNAWWSCASSTYTLKAGIENMLTHYVAEVTSVEGVDDQESEVAPYYS